MNGSLTRARRAAVSLVLLLASCVTAGCVSVPNSSSIEEGRAVGVQDDPQHITNDPPGPLPGASPQAIASGFFAAMLAYPQTVTTAREFLTSRAAAQWDHGAGVVVYEGRSFIRTANGIAVGGEQLGRLDERGTWTSVKPEQSTSLVRLRMAEVDGEWRITNPPPGLYIDSTYFSNNYGKFSLYFFDPSHKVLAADPVYLVDDETATTALVADLVDGPTRSLRQAVQTAIPRETTIDVAVSTSSSGVAEVPLSEEILQLSADNLQLVAAQLAWTLRQIPDIRSISVTVDGSQLEIPGFGPTFGVDQFSGYDPAGITGVRKLFALSPRGLVSLSGGAAARVVTAGTLEEQPLSAAVDADGVRAAFVTEAGRAVMVSALAVGSDVGSADWLRGTSFLRPVWDLHGVLWAVDSVATGSDIYVATTARNERLVRAPGLRGADIVSFAVSRDGVRFAAVVRDGDTTRLVISTIERDPRRPSSLRLGVPTSVPALTSATDGAELTDMTSLAWVSPTAVVVLAGGEDADRHPWQVEVDGSRTADVGQYLPVVPDSVAADVNQEQPIAVGAGSQVFVQEPDLQWVRVGEGTRLRMPFYG
ncbi:MAG TPA: LpqB family beta-propeller domain-containing protein [Nocardioidaceae bacterium]|nr:LpqB family beta-propeller domain-containing protein [Nocardioidaceae bacterium]